jgi:hypothetical protein
VRIGVALCLLTLGVILGVLFDQARAPHVPGDRSVDARRTPGEDDGSVVIAMDGEQRLGIEPAPAAVMDREPAPGEPGEAIAVATDWRDIARDHLATTS